MRSSALAKSSMNPPSKPECVADLDDKLTRAAEKSVWLGDEQTVTGDNIEFGLRPHIPAQAAINAEIVADIVELRERRPLQVGRNIEIDLDLADMHDPMPQWQIEPVLHVVQPQEIKRCRAHGQFGIEFDTAAAEIVAALDQTAEHDLAMKRRLEPGARANMFVASGRNDDAPGQHERRLQMFLDPPDAKLKGILARRGQGCFEIKEPCLKAIPPVGGQHRDDVEVPCAQEFVGANTVAVGRLVLAN